MTDIIQPDVAVVNNVLPVHVEGIGGVDAIAEEKGCIYSHSQSGAAAVIGLESPYVNLFTGLAGQNRKIYYGRRSHCAAVDTGAVDSSAVDNAVTYVLADNVELDAERKTARFQLNLGEDIVPVNLQVPGEHNVFNALAASACAVALGIDPEAVRRGLESFTGVSGRMQIKHGALGAKIIDDTYNASPGSVRVAIDYLKQFPNTAVALGDMGELGTTANYEHFGVGKYARDAGIGQLYAVGKYAAEVVKGFGPGGIQCGNQNELVEKLKGGLTSSTVVLVKGSRSTRMENVVAALTDDGVQ